MAVLISHITISRKVQIITVIIEIPKNGLHQPTTIQKKRANIDKFLVTDYLLMSNMFCSTWNIYSVVY